MDISLFLLLLGMVGQSNRQKFGNNKTKASNTSKETIQVIVECSMEDEEECQICQLGKVKYRLPMIDST